MELGQVTDATENLLKIVLTKGELEEIIILLMGDKEN